MGNTTGCLAPAAAEASEETASIAPSTPGIPSAPPAPDHMLWDFAPRASAPPERPAQSTRYPAIDTVSTPTLYRIAPAPAPAPASASIDDSGAAPQSLDFADVAKLIEATSAKTSLRLNAQYIEYMRPFDDSEVTCHLCLEQQLIMINGPCGHRTTCEACSRKYLDAGHTTCMRCTQRLEWIQTATGHISVAGGRDPPFRAPGRSAHAPPDRPACPDPPHRPTPPSRRPTPAPALANPRPPSRRPEPPSRPIPTPQYIHTHDGYLSDSSDDSVETMMLRFERSTCLDSKFRSR